VESQTRQRAVPRAEATSVLVGGVLHVRLTGTWRIAHAASIEEALNGIDPGTAKQIEVDNTALGDLDLSSAWLLHAKLNAWSERGATVCFTPETPRHFAFIEAMTGKALEPKPEAARSPALLRAVGGIGRVAVEHIAAARAALAFFGRVTATAVQALASPKRLRVPSITRHIYETGLNAVPIVSLIAFLISVILAYLGAEQLRRFGADIFTVDLVAIAVLREMGVLLTAIIIAGRSGSAFAAEIGVMRLNDEVDALEAMGLDPVEVLVLPRVLGLVIALPLLTIVADAMGLMGGGLLSALLLDITWTQYWDRLQEALSPTTFWAGLLKAPVFAVLIALVGTYRGMQVRNSSRELGRLTTASVVQSIFLVILADAVFAVVYVELGF
jgi:phospholipid/cholesterol/gamma-HCH transport system permease protein